VENTAAIPITAPAAKWVGSKRTALPLLGAVGVLWFVLCRHLSSEWSINEQYSYGWFVHFFAAYLFWLRWEDRPEADVSSIGSSRFRIGLIALGGAVALALFFLLPLRLFEVGNPDWRPLGWIHATIVVALTFLMIWRIGGLGWVRHFAFPICGSRGRDTEPFRRAGAARGQPDSH
jgi:hypothetical protein